jgi:hypothetical protein
MISLVNNQGGSFSGVSNDSLPKQTLEINPKHTIMLELFEMKEKNPEFASIIVEQVFDNALVAAGLLDEPRTMLPRINSLMERFLISERKQMEGAAAGGEKKKAPKKTTKKAKKEVVEPELME